MTDITRWCATTDFCRHSLEQPFPWRDKSIGCNGHVALLLDDGGAAARAAQAATATAHPTDEAFARVVEQIDWTAGRVPVPTWQRHDPPTRPCSNCSGTGVVHHCTDCGGTGEKTCYACDQDCDCRSCAGTGIAPQGSTATTEPCDDCGGSGSTTTVEVVNVEIAPHVHVDQRYLDLTATLPEVVMLAPAPRKPGEPMAPVGFVWAHGRAIIMPRFVDERDLVVHIVEQVAA